MLFRVQHIAKNPSHFYVIFDLNPLEKWRNFAVNNNGNFLARRIINHKVDRLLYNNERIKQSIIFIFFINFSIQVHGKYTTTDPYKYNLALIQLDKPINLTTPIVAETPLPYISHYRPYCKEYSEVDYTDVYMNHCFFYGYGPNRYDNTTHRTGILKRFHLPLLNSRYCRYFDATFDLKSNLCAGHKRVTNKDEKFKGFIGGDFGGPLVCSVINVRNFKDVSKRLVVGIASMSALVTLPDHSLRLFDYFSSTRFFRDWIEDVSDRNRL